MQRQQKRWKTPLWLKMALGMFGTICILIDTQVFTLFEQGKSPVEVAIELDLRSEEVTKLYRQWWQLKGLHELSQVYEETKNDISEFIRVYKFIKKETYTPRQVVDTVSHLEELPLLTSRLELIR